MNYSIDTEVRVTMSKVLHSPPTLLGDDFVEGKISSIVADFYYVRVDTKTGFTVLSCKDDAIEVIGNVECTVRPRECECGAEFTSFPNNHSDWCKLYRGK